MRRILVFGTFDILHPGHIHFLKQAKKLGDFLIVSLARTKNIHRIKGSKSIHTEQMRKMLVQSLKIVDKVVLGAKDDYISHIVAQKPDIIALGYDQNAFTKNLAVKLKLAGWKTKIVRLKPYKKNLYKSKKILSII